MKPKPFLLFAVPLLLIKPCSATRTLFETVRNTLYSNAAFPAPSEELLRNVRSLADDYEAKILKNLRQLSVASMRDLLAFLRKDALSLEGVLMKIETDGYQNASGQQCQENVFCFHHLSRWFFDKIQCELTNPPDASKPNFRHLSDTTLKIFREAEALFQEYVQACAKIFYVTEEIAEIVRTGIRSWYDLKKSDILTNELHKDPWYLAARASDGSWSTVLYSVMVPHTMQFSSKKMEDFINSVTTCFNKCVDGFDATCGDCLKEEIKARFRANCFEYLLRSVYVRYNTPSAERDNLVRAILKYARETSDGSAPRPSEIKHTLGHFYRNVGTKSASHTGMDTASVIITGVHFELTEAIKSVVHEKMNKLFRHEPDIIRVRVELTKDVDKKDKNTFEAKGIIELRGPNFVVSTFSDNLYNAIDDLEEKLLRKLRNRARLMKTKRKEACISG